MRKFNLIALNKPFRVLSQFTDRDNRPTLSEYVEEKHFYPTGRLDYDSEGLLLLTCDGHIQSAFSHPENKINKYYWVQVEGDITEENCRRLMSGVNLSDGFASAVKCSRIEDPDIWQRNPSIRTRKNIPTSWIEIITLVSKTVMKDAISINNMEPDSNFFLANLLSAKGNLKLPLCKTPH